MHPQIGNLKMRFEFAIAKSMIFIVMGFAQSSWADPQTTPYIAIHTTPKYSSLSALPYANPRAPKGGYISRSDNGTFDNLNSMNGKGAWVEGTDYLFDSLMSKSYDEPNVFYPLLAEKVTFDPNKTHFVIFHLNPKARFSDGTPVLAEDVKFSFDTYQTKSNFGLQMYLSDLAKTEVLSKYQVKMVFKSNHNSEMPTILASMPIYSKKDWQKKDFTKITLKPILGSGPYLVDSIDPGRSIKYKRNPNYWGKDLMVNRGRYNFDSIRYVYYRSNDIAFEGFKAGQFTLQEENQSRKWVNEYNFPAFNSGLVTKYIAKFENPEVTQSYAFNTRRKPFNDIYFRQALNIVYDFEWQNKALFYGQYARMKSHFQNSELEAKSVPDAREMAILKPYLDRLHPLQRRGVLNEWKPIGSDGSGYNRKAMLHARSILLNAGYHYKNGQLIDKKGQTIKFEFIIHQDGLQRTLMPFVRNLKKLGIQVSVRQLDLPQYLERMRKYDFDMTSIAMPQSLTPGNEQYQLWGSKAANEFGNYNYPGVRNAVVDEVIKKMLESKNREDLVVATRVLDRLLRAGYYQILTYGNNKKWYAYWDMYEQPRVKPKLTLGEDYWWSNPVKEKKVAQYLRKK